jgi:hypothetical protein
VYLFQKYYFTEHLLLLGMLGRILAKLWSFAMNMLPFDQLAAGPWCRRSHKFQKFHETNAVLTNAANNSMAASFLLQHVISCGLPVWQASSSGCCDIRCCLHN